MLPLQRDDIRYSPVKTVIDPFEPQNMGGKKMRFLPCGIHLKAISAPSEEFANRIQAASASCQMKGRASRGTVGISNFNPLSFREEEEDEEKRGIHRSYP